LPDPNEGKVEGSQNKKFVFEVDMLMEVVEGYQQVRFFAPS
jgi:hypothetical protein